MRSIGPSLLPWQREVGPFEWDQGSAGGSHVDVLVGVVLAEGQVFVSSGKGVRKFHRVVGISGSLLCLFE